MCTLIALHRCVPGAHLIVAANRDEFLDRPSEPPAPRGNGIAAPLDRREGGTWLGVNASGVFAAITNRPGPRDDARRSRGRLVMDVLAAGSARQAAERLEGVPVRAYNGFNLFVADAHEAYVAVYRDAVKVFALRPGAHVVGNDEPDTRTQPKGARLLARAERLVGSECEAVERELAAICRGHEGQGGPLDDTCIHAGDYGTRSSTLLRLGEPGGASRWRWAEGPPCRAAYADIDHLLGGLGRPPGASESTARSAS